MNLMLFGGMMCPYGMVGGKMCPISGGMDDLWCVGIKIFLVVWVIFVPIVITARLDKIVKLLQDKK